MLTPLAIVKLRRKRDLLLVRQRARQLAGLLGFSPSEQVHIAAAVFEVACRACQLTGCGTLQFQVADDVLQVFPLRHGQPAAGLRLEKPLPPEAPPLAQEDWRWAVQELAQITPPNLFEEIRQHNQELLRTLQELRASQAELAGLQRMLGQSSAA